ncbi:FAD-binding domain-containing protein [Hymenopellis radicata]|nr:FAD-binding domain-containing protein [Hymenopellis radicata]
MAPAYKSAPGDAGFPSDDAWGALNASISGRLVTVVPSGQFCKDRGGCTDAEWTSSVFRANVPGAMNQLNWEQNFESDPAQICLRNTTGNCEQGNVPLYAVLASSADDVKAGIAFAQTYNLRVAVKASGHDYLGRSTARDSLLISTHLLQDISFSEDYQIGNQSQGSAVTVGSGVFLNKLYPAAKAEGKIVIGGTAGTVIAAGGYVQGAGHSALSPLLGLAADNVLQFQVVTGNAEVVTVDETQNSDLFWALRGGGAGSWGVIISATFRTFPTFNGIVSSVLVHSNDSTTFGNVMAVHAKHIFDLDDLRPAQYFYARRNATSNQFNLIIATFFPNVSAEAATSAMQPLLDDIVANGGTIGSQSVQEANFDDTVTTQDDVVAQNLAMGSRLFPEAVYRNSPDAIGQMYTKLFDAGSNSVLGHLVAGGQVTENADIDSAVHPAWRSAKTHMILVNQWQDNIDASLVPSFQTEFQTIQLPIMEEVIGSDAGSYSNEADLTEPNFQTTFYGPNYDKLSTIKSKYDPADVFIVAGGIGSERWDADGFCKI